MFSQDNAQGNLNHVHKYLKKGVQKTEPGPTHWYQGQDKMKLWSNIRKKCFSSNDRQTCYLESLWVSILGFTQNPARHRLLCLILLLAGRWTRPPPDVPSHLSHSAVLRGFRSPVCCRSLWLSWLIKSQHPSSNFSPKLLEQTVQKQFTEQEGTLTITQEVLFE